MGTIKGQNLRVMVGGKCIAMATSCQFHISAQMEDSSTKDSTGDWQEQEVVGLSWDAQTDSLVTLEDNGTNGELPQDLLSLIINKTKVQLTFDQTAGTNNRTGQNAVIKKTGYAYLTDVQVTAANRQNSTLMQIQRDGDLLFFEFSDTNPDSGEKFHYICYFFKASDAFWSIQFATHTDDLATQRPAIIDYAKSIQFIQ